MTNFERNQRELEPDLELGKQHLQDILDQILPFVKEDEQKNNLAIELKAQIEKIDSSLGLKKEVKQIQELYNEASLVFLNRREDREKRNEIHRRLQELESKLKFK